MISLRSGLLLPLSLLTACAPDPTDLDAVQGEEMGWEADTKAPAGGSCTAMVTRDRAFWSTASNCVFNGSATPMAVLPQTVGTTTYSTAAAAKAFLARAFGTGAANTRSKLGQEVLTAKINSTVFGIGDIAYLNVDGVPDLETVDEVIAYGEALYTAGTTAARTTAYNRLLTMNSAGSTANLYFSTSCTADPEICDLVDNDGDGTVDDDCGCIEICDGVDNNDDGTVDEGCASVDADGDGYDETLDCDDTDPAINPGATEVRGDGIDQDCDGSDLAYTFSYATNIQTIWTARCVSCHTATHSTGLDLTTGNSYALLVNVASAELPSMDRIEPGSTATSYLFHKVSNTQASVGGSGNRMPPSGAALTAAQITIIGTWITEGAPNN